jgi:hypothetical protein
MHGASVHTDQGSQSIALGVSPRSGPSQDCAITLISVRDDAVALAALRPVS